MERRVLVIGSRGFLGAALISKLSALPETIVYGINRQADTKLPHAHRIVGDVISHDWATTLNTIRPHVIYHVAGADAQMPFSYQLLLYVEGTRRLLQAIVDSGQRPRLILAGSAAEYGLKNEVLSELSVCHPDGEYGIAKLAQTELASAYGRKYGLNITTARIFNVYGGSARTLSIAAMAAQIAAAELAPTEHNELNVYNLKSYRDFIHIDDVTEALIMLANRPMSHEAGYSAGIADQVYNIASGQSVSLGRVLDRLLASSTRDGHELQMKGLRMHGSQREEFSRANIDKIKQHTGWSPKISLSEGLERELDYWRDKMGVPRKPAKNRPNAMPLQAAHKTDDSKGLAQKLSIPVVARAPETEQELWDSSIIAARHPEIFQSVSRQLNANPAHKNSLQLV